MTLQQCMAAAGMPLAANGAAVTSGGVYSLEPTYVSGVSYPGKPPNSTWIATTASFPDTASPGSFLRDILQRLAANFYGTANQPAGAPCNTTAAPQTFTQILGNLPNDVIVTTASQSSGASQAPNVTVTDSGNLEHTGTPADGFGAALLKTLLGDTDTNVLSSTGVDTTIQTYLKTP